MAKEKEEVKAEEKKEEVVEEKGNKVIRQIMDNNGKMVEEEITVL